MRSEHLRYIGTLLLLLVAVSTLHAQTGQEGPSVQHCCASASKEGMEGHMNGNWVPPFGTLAEDSPCLPQCVDDPEEVIMQE